jgi:hypothetical protein
LFAHVLTPIFTSSWRGVFCRSKLLDANSLLRWKTLAMTIGENVIARRFLPKQSAGFIELASLENARNDDF